MVGRPIEPVVAGGLNGFARRSNPLDPLIWKLNAGQNATLQIWGDSTSINGSPDSVFGTQDRRYIGQWADQLITSGRLDKWSSGCGLRINRWLNGKYDPAYLETLRASTNGVYLDIYLGSVSGSAPHYLMGNYFLPALGSVPADTLIICHGINISTWGDEALSGAFLAMVEQYRAEHPETSIGFVTPHPNRDTTAYDRVTTMLKARASALRASISDDAYRAFQTAGKPATWYNSDGIHESPTLGCAPYIAALNSWWDTAYPVMATFRPSRFVTPASRSQLLLNGDFRSWSNTAAVPDGWNSTGTIAFSRDTSIYAEARKAFSVRMTSSGGTATRITQQLLSGYTLGPDRLITLAARLRKDSANNVTTLGRIGLSWAGPSAGSYTHPAMNIQQSGFAWWAISVAVPADVTSVTASIYIDSATPPNGTDGIYLDQVSAVPGPAPLAFS